jgi:uncharacterized protein (TIGR02466 family)
VNNTEFNIVPLFPTPLYTSSFKITDNEKQQLYKQEFERVQADNGYVTVNKCILDLPQFLKIKTDIEKRFHNYLDNVLYVDRTQEYPPLEFYITNSWVVKQVSGDWGHQHSHQNSLFAGIIYLDVSHDTGEITFHDKPASGKLFPHLFHIPMKKQTLITANAMAFQPKNDDIFLFPSHLEHTIGKHTGTMIRYSLAFNFWFKGKLGQYAGELILK